MRLVPITKIARDGSISRRTERQVSIVHDDPCPYPRFQKLDSAIEMESKDPDCFPSGVEMESVVAE